MKEHHRIKNELRAEVGGNIVKGPKADEFRRRLREAGLLPGGKEEGTSRREISLDREEQAKAYRDMGMKTKDAVAQAKSDIPSEKSSLAPADKKASRDIYSKAHSDVERLLRGETPIHEEFKYRPPSLPSHLKRELEALAAKDHQAENPKSLAEKLPTGSASGDTRYAKQDAADFDKNFKSAKHQGGTYDWNETTKPGTKKIGEGSFGTVLMTKGPPPVAVKRGEISEHEADIIAKVGKADIGPRLIAGDIEKGGRTSYGVKMSNGRIAMSVVPGKQLMDMESGTKIGNTTAGDAYWAARATLHRMGIAHNDMHPGNLLIDETGKGRWVDMGLAHDSAGAALAEALGVLKKPEQATSTGRGDWQGRKWASHTGNSDGRLQFTAPDNLKRMQENHNTKVLPFLHSKNLDDDEIGSIMMHGIREPLTSYVTGHGFDKLSENDMLHAINLLYDGI